MDTRGDPFDIVGKRIGGGKYLVTDVVDNTTFSVVYRATHVVWARHVAIKVFHVASDATAEARAELLASFVREGALLGELSETCSAICQARDIGALRMPDGGRVPYMVLEWLEGESLEASISRERKNGGRRRTVAEVTHLLGSIAEALGCAHDRGVSHCDIKPGNIVVLDSEDAGDPRCKLLDFGAARVERPRHDSPGRRPDVTRRPFTPAFGAPEQFDEAYGDVGPWTDVFALALTVVELLTGGEALQGQDVWLLASQACDESRRPTPRAFGVDVGDEVEAVLHQALAVHPLMRFPDVGSFWSALVRASTAPSVSSVSAVSSVSQVTATDAAFVSGTRDAVTQAEGNLSMAHPATPAPIATLPSLPLLPSHPSLAQVPARRARAPVSRLPAVVALALSMAVAFGAGHVRAQAAAHRLSSVASVVALAR
jgi:eukaryotic-like serine/threonine-protein kinase